METRARALLRPDSYENVYYGAKARERHTHKGVSSNCLSPFRLRVSGGQKTRERKKTPHTEQSIEWRSLSLVFISLFFHYEVGFTKKFQKKYEAISDA